MKKSVLFFGIILITILTSKAQPFDYYSSTPGLEGTTLKDSLHEIIKSHVEYHYSSVKQIIRIADEDPVNPDNLILFYTGWSIPKTNFASVLDSLNYWNREHVWAKSHGDFGTDPGTGTDAHAIRPVDNTVNSARSYLDFDNGGTEYLDAGIPTGCYKDGDSWEPRDDVKGDVARIIFYMATRYEGTNGEIDLEVVDAVNTYPDPEHGKLSTLLQWNLQDPPDEFEKNRNEVVFNWQHNRNPFIDYPEFAEYIWNSVSASPVYIQNVTSNPAQPEENDIVTISADITENAGGTITSAILEWGLSWGNLSNQVALSASGNNYSGQIPGQAAATKVYFRITATTATESKHFFGSYQVANVPFTGTLTSIYDIQGQTTSTPYNGQVISTAGVVTAVFGNNFFMQNGQGAWNGIYVYNSGYFPVIGDSIIVTAEVSEYYDLTELKNVSAFYPISSNNPLPEPVILPTGSIQDEQYECVLVRVEDAQCVRDTAYGMWIVNDGSGDALIHNSSIYSHNYGIGNYYNITGPLNFDFGEFKIELRGPDDVETGIDSNPPFAMEVLTLSNIYLHVNFNEDLEQSTAETVSNYSINNGITVTNALLHATDRRKVILTVSALTHPEYILTINQVEDLAGNAINNQEIAFSTPYTIDNEIIANWQIFPNPVIDNIYLNLEDNPVKEIRITIFDFCGRPAINSHHDNPELIRLDVSNLQAGMYFIEIESDNRYHTSKFVKIR